MPLILGWFELKEIKEGRSSYAGRGYAIAGFVLGLVSIILFILGLIWLLFVGGLAFLKGLLRGSGGQWIPPFLP